VRGAISDGRPYRDNNPHEHLARTGGFAARVSSMPWVIPRHRTTLANGEPQTANPAVCRAGGGPRYVLLFCNGAVVPE